MLTCNGLENAVVTLGDTAYEQMCDLRGVQKTYCTVCSERARVISEWLVSNGLLRKIR
jgi:hypothetical protein